MKTQHTSLSHGSCIVGWGKFTSWPTLSKIDGMLKSVGASTCTSTLPCSRHCASLSSLSNQTKWPRSLTHTHTLTMLKHTFELETAGIKCNLLLIEGCTSSYIRWSSVPIQLQFSFTLIDGHSLTRMASSPWQLLHSLFEFCWRGEDSAKAKPLQQQRIWCLPRSKTITILQTGYKNRNPTKGSTTAAIMSSDAQSGRNTPVFVPELLKNTRNLRHTHTI